MKTTELELKILFADVFGIEASMITDGSSPDNIGTWDSSRHLFLILAIEEKYAISVSAEESLDMVNYGMVKLILQQKDCLDSVP